MINNRRKVKDKPYSALSTLNYMSSHTFHIAKQTASLYVKLRASKSTRKYRCDAL